VLLSVPGAVTIVSMNQVPQARVRFSRIGMRMFAAGMLAVSVGAVAFVITHLPGDGKSASQQPGATPPAASLWGKQQAGYNEIDAPVAKALKELPVRVRLAAVAGAPAGVYRATHSIRVRYASGSHFGVYLVTVWGSRYGVGPRAIRARASTCRACTHNRLLQLAPGVPAAIAAGGGHPSTVIWRQGGLTFEVRGPGTTFSNRDAVAAARAVARANA
jgi:hypothetical protein